MKTVDFSETIAACNLKVNIQGQGHFLTLAQGYLHMKIKTCFSQEPLDNF